jgi:hypothetical protein
MALCHRLELLTADGLLHVFTQYGWSTEYSAFDVKSERVRGATSENILDIAPQRNRFGQEVEHHQSVTLPSISRILKRGTFTVLPGMSGTNPTYDVNIGRVVAVHRTEGQYVTA